MKRAIAFILSLMMVLSVLATGLAGEVSAAEDLAFTLPEIIPAKGIEDFIGEWYRRMGVLSDCSEGWQNNDPGGNAGNRTSG